MKVMFFAAFLLVFFPQATLLQVFEPQVASPGGVVGQDQHASLPSAPGIGDIHKLTAAGKYQEALPLARQIEARSPNAPGLHHELGVIHYHLGELSEAIATLRQAIAESEADHEAQQLLGMSYFQLGKPAEAIPWMEKIQHLMPAGNVDTSYVLGLCYLNVKDYEKR